MNTEFEAKFYPVDKDEYRERLTSVGAKLSVPERKMRRVIADRYKNKGLNCDYIRVRDEGNLVRLSAKIHADADGKVGDQKEDDVEVSDFDSTVKVLEDAGLIFNRYQETLREEWELGQSTITIDTWPGLDPYSEIEADSIEGVKSTAEKLGFSWDRRILTAAAEIFCKVYAMEIDEVLEKISGITFENNPFEGMKKVWPKE